MVGLPPVSERTFQSQVVQLARANGWLLYHTFDSRRSAAGFPDLTLVREGELVFLELKSDKGRVTPEQQQWLAELAACGHVAEVARPRDWKWLEGVLRRRRS